MDWEAAGHTAEHAFMGALTRIKDVKPVKVEHRGMRGVITLEAEGLDWGHIAKAVEEANKIIFEGRSVREHLFENLEEARKAFPGMRAHERVSGRIRVVEIEGYDYAACARRHAKNTSEARLFVVKDLRSKRRGLYEVEFLVGPDAAKYIASIEGQVGLSAKELNCKPWELYERVRGLKLAKEGLERAKARLSRQLARAARPEFVKGVEVYSGIVEDVDEKRFMEEITQKVKRGLAAYAMVSGGRCKVFVVQKGIDFDCGRTLSEVLKRHGGKGGGRKEFGMGGAPAGHEKEILEEIIAYL